MIDWNQIFRDFIVWVVPAGAFVTLLIFWLNHKPPLRNYFTREFQVDIEQDGGNVVEGQVRSSRILIRLTARNSEPIKIIDLYFKYSNKASGYSRSRQGIPNHGRYDLEFWDTETKGVFSHSKVFKFTFMNSNGFLPKFEDGRIRHIQVVVKTNKYGITKSAEYLTSNFLFKK